MNDEMKKTDYCISCISEKDHNKWGDTKFDIPIISDFDMIKRYKEGTIKKVVIGTDRPVVSIRAIVKELCGMGIEEKDLLFFPIQFCKDVSEEADFISLEQFDYLNYLEFHITHRCNLNCAGCSHFVPLIPSDEEVDYPALLQDLEQLRRKVSHISRIRIMGGEPLLAKELADCCAFTRRLWPYSDIHVASNGLLAHKMGNEIVKTFLDNDICLDVTCYVKELDSYYQIAEFLKETGIRFSIEDVRYEMMRVLRKHSIEFPADTTYSFCECYNLFHGELYPCPVMAYLEYFNSYFGVHYPFRKGVNIYSDKTFRDIFDEITKKQELCDYCNNWRIGTDREAPLPKRIEGRADIGDWVVD